MTQKPLMPLYCTAFGLPYIGIRSFQRPSASPEGHQRHLRFVFFL